DGTQGWCEWRRTGVPAIKPTTYSTNSSGQIPRRYTYGTTEYSLNAAGVAQGVATLSGGDTQDSRVWWDN
ncbi:MAG: SusD/RagB family nutrient-binding outer membrane lipoprotein, partial [Chitinophagaceae bacterium]|nr:SusD/RagB family nutrient-binding outer membrane lipoprotein [Chitinophagaceae bacterium]